ncbi:hypothetical protein CR513_28891, partial [Mucuna pruriens]
MISYSNNDRGNIILEHRNPIAKEAHSMRYTNMLLFKWGHGEEKHVFYKTLSGRLAKSVQYYLRLTLPQ